LSLLIVQLNEFNSFSTLKKQSNQGIFLRQKIDTND